MNLEHLKYFLVLSQCEHYRQAAEQLCISQPGLSHAIASLEEDLGVPLFRKKGRNITLTQYGKMLQNDASKILAMIDKSRDSFSNILNGGGTIHLSGITRLATFLLPHLVKNYKECVDTKGDFKLYTGNTQNVIQGVKDDKSLQNLRLISLRIEWILGRRRAMRSSCHVSNASGMTVWLV